MKNTYVVIYRYIDNPTEQLERIVTADSFGEAESLIWNQRIEILSISKFRNLKKCII